MRAFRLHQPAPAESEPLRLETVPTPEPGPGALRLRVEACGICHTDLHTVEGELAPPAYPVIPGHQVVGRVEAVGPQVAGWAPGARAGVAWLHHACGACAFCARGEENLCQRAAFTGLHADGGYAEALTVPAAFALRLPEALEPSAAAPLLCAGIIGYRSLRKADLQPGEHLGLFGFGASAHLALQIARHWGCTVSVFTRSAAHRALARELGAAWVGGAGQSPPQPLDRAVLFAPAGELVPPILERLRPGGTLAINAIHMSPIPSLPYARLYGERTVRSVANATRADGQDLLRLAAEIPLHATVQRYAFEQAGQALVDLKHSRIDGAGVLVL